MLKNSYIAAAASTQGSLIKVSADGKDTNNHQNKKSFYFCDAFGLAKWQEIDINT